MSTIPQVRLTSVNGMWLGIMSLADAKTRAADSNCKLKIIIPDADPPVARLYRIGEPEPSQEV